MLFFLLIMLFPNAPYIVRLCSSIFRLCSYMFQLCSSNTFKTHSYRLDMVQKKSFPPGMHALQKIFSSRNFLQLVWEYLDTFRWRYSPLDASCRCYSLRIRSDAWSGPLERRGWWYSFSCASSLHMIIVWLQQLIVTPDSAVLELEQWILVSSSLSLPGTLAVAGAPRTIIPYFIPALCRISIPALCRISSDYSCIMPAPWTCLLLSARNYAGASLHTTYTWRIHFRNGLRGTL